MIAALWLFALQGCLGAFDTVYYHEWKARLVGRVPGTSPELVLHGVRDLIYALLFASLPFVRWQGALAFALAALIAAEIVITLRDFIVEDTVRLPLGGVYPGERAMHAVMGIVYGAALANLAPDLVESAKAPTGFLAWQAPEALRLLMPAMALGVFASGVRDLAATRGARWAQFPWATAGERR